MRYEPLSLSRIISVSVGGAGVLGWSPRSAPHGTEEDPTSNSVLFYVEVEAEYGYKIPASMLYLLVA